MDNYMDPFMVITGENPIHCASQIRSIRSIRSIRVRKTSFAQPKSLNQKYLNQ